MISRTLEESGRTLEQRRALYALQVIERHKANDGAEYKKRYSTLVHGLPSMVLQNGLGQALAYLVSDAEDKSAREKASRALYDELQEWLCGTRSRERPERVYVHGSDLITALMAGSRTDYQWAQVSALTLLGWMRRFAQAYL